MEDPLLLTDNFYKKIPESEKIALIELENERIREVKQAADLARACMNSEQFIKYKAQYSNLEEKTVENMIKYTRNYFKGGDVTLENYAMTMMRYILQLSTLRLIVDQVEAHA